MPAGGNSDFLYSVGVDLTKANDELQVWSSSTVPRMLQGDGKAHLQIRVGYAAAKTNIQNFVAYAKAALKDVPPINVTFNFRGATRSLNAFVKNFSKNAGAIKELEGAMAGLDAKATSLANSYGRFNEGSNSLKGSLGSIEAAAVGASGGVERVTSSAVKGGTAIDYLGKIAGATAFKFVEWQVAIQGLNAVTGAFSDALRNASEVQMEKTLQGLYNLTGATVDVNQALQNATTIAQQWGGNIVDIQQVIGLWTKQTHDLAAATVLANQGEEMARASGVSTQEVYQKSIAIGTQMGLTYGQLPTVYDQITRAALNLAEPLRAVNERAGEGQEAMKDLLEGLSEASATLSANSFRDTASIIAMVANQIQAMGESGKNAAKNLSTMFGALSQGGPKRAEWEKILGVDAFKDAGSLLEAMKTHLKELQQAQANGLLGVRPQQVETLATMEKSLDNILRLYTDISTKSKGMLDVAAIAEMGTYQAQVQKLQTSVQAFEIELGTRMLPTLQSFVNYLATGVLPEVQHLTPEILAVAQAATQLGGAFLLASVGAKGWQWLQQGYNYFMSFSAGARAAAAAQAEATAAGYSNAASMQLNALAVQKLKTAHDAELAIQGELAESYAMLGDAAGLSAEQLNLLTESQIKAGQATQALITQEQELITYLRAVDEQIGLTADEMNALAAAETSAATRTETFNAALVETKGLATTMPSALNSIGAGIVGVAGAAADALGPLLAMYGAILAVQGLAAGGSKYSNAALGVEERGQESIQGKPGFIANTFLNPLNWPGNISKGAQTLSARMQGKGWQLNSTGALVPQWLNDAMLKNPSVGSQYKHDLTEWYSPGGKNQDNLTAIQRDIKEYGAQADALHMATGGMKEFTSIIKQLNAAGKAALSGHMGAGPEDRTFANIPPKSSGGGNPYTQQLSQTTTAYDALIAQKKALVARDEAEIKANEDLAKVYGDQPQYIAKINAAYQDEIKQYQAIAAAIHAQITATKEEEQHYEAVAHAASSSSKTKKEASDAAAKSQSDLVRLSGEYAEAEAKVTEAIAAHSLAMEQLNEKNDLASLGLTNVTGRLKEMTDNMDLLKGHTVAQLGVGQEYLAQIQNMALGLSLLIAHYQNLGYQTKDLQTILDSVEGSLKTVSEAVKSDVTDLGKLGDEVTKLGNSLASENFKGVGDLLGFNKQTINYVDQMLQASQQIAAAQQQIFTYSQQLAQLQSGQLTPAQQQYVQYLQQAVQADTTELNIKKQILPLEQQILQIRSSPAYTAWASELDKFGDKDINSWMAKLFGGGGAGSVFERPGNGWMKDFHEFMSPIGGGIMSNLWQQLVPGLTTSLFGGSGAQSQLQSMGNQIYGSLIQAMKTDFQPPANALVQAFTTATPAMNSLATALNSSGGSGVSAGPTAGGLTGPVTFGAPDIWQAFDDRYQVPDDSEIGNSASNLDTIAQNTTQIAANTQDTNNTLTSANTTLSKAAAAPTNVTISNLGGSTTTSGASSLGLLASLFGSGGSGALLSAAASPQIASAMAALSGSASSGIKGITSAMFGSPGSAITSSLGLGSLFGAILGSDTGQAGTSQREQYGMFGGLFGLGGALALAPLITGAAAGPAGLAVGALVGGLLGSLFGDHFPISDEPDIGEPNIGGVTYGQFVANMTGEPGSFNGQTMQPFGQYDGPQDAESYQLEQDLQKVLNNPNAPPNLKQMAQQLQKLNPTNEPYGFSIQSEYNDVFTLHSGAKVNVEDYMNLVQQFMATYASTMGNQPLAPLISINGVGVGAGWGPNPYNTPGMNSSLFQQEEQVWASGNGSGNGTTPPLGGYSYAGGQSAGGVYGGGGMAYSTPGVGVGASGYSSPWGSGQGYQAQMQSSNGGSVTVQLVVDGKVLAQIVNAYNAQYLLNSGRSIQQVPVIQ